MANDIVARGGASVAHDMLAELMIQSMDVIDVAEKMIREAKRDGGISVERAELLAARLIETAHTGMQKGERRMAQQLDLEFELDCSEVT